MYLTDNLNLHLQLAWCQKYQRFMTRKQLLPVYFLIRLDVAAGTPETTKIEPAVKGQWNSIQVIRTRSSIPHHLHDWWFQLVPVPNLGNGDHCYREADHVHGCYSLSTPSGHPVQLNHGKRCRQYEPSVALWLRSYFAAQQAFGPDLQEFLLSAGIAYRVTDISNTTQNEDWPFTVLKSISSILSILPHKLCSESRLGKDFEFRLIITWSLSHR